MKLIAQAMIQIQKPIEEVFEGIVNPDKMTGYFISESSGRLETGREITWKFPEFKDTYPLKDITVEPPHFISYVWDPETVVTMTLEEQPDKSTVIKVVENGKSLSEKNLQWLVGNTGGWANFLASMKAYLEYDVSLRKGAFDFMKKDEIDSPDHITP